MATILIIEDNPPIRGNIIELLEFEGYNTLSAANGVEGLELAIAHIPDLILCNVIMPEKDGFEVASTIRATKATQLIRFVFLSAKTEKAYIRQGMIHADDYLTKPFDSSDLLKVVEAQLKRAEIIQSNIRLAAKSDRTHGDR